MDIADLLAQRAGIRLDIGCGAKCQPGFVGMDRQSLPGVEIVWDWNNYPWPLPDETVLTAIASHVVEHVNPVDGAFLRWMDELWRICRPGAQVALAYPHGSSQRFLQDPTHCNALNENSFWYFDPAHALYDYYTPRPWHVEYRAWSPAGDCELILVKLSLAEATVQRAQRLEAVAP